MNTDSPLVAAADNVASFLLTLFAAAIDIVRRRSTRARRQAGMAAFCRCLVDKGVSLPRSIKGSIDRSILPPAMIRSSCKLPHVIIPLFLFDSNFVVTK